MKRTILCLIYYSGCLLMFRSAAHGQVALADQYFDAAQFYKAAALYQSGFRQDTTNDLTAFRLGECYRHMFDYAKAQGYYGKVQKEATSAFPLSVFYYALMLKYNRHFEEAIRYFDRFVEEFPAAAFAQYRAQAKIEKQGCYLALLEDEAAPDYRFNRVDLPVNTSSQDYAPAIFLHDSLLVVTSSRTAAKGKTNNRSGEHFTDQFMFEKTKNGWQKAALQHHFDVVNTSWSDGPGCFNKTKDSYYFTSCREKDGLCRIYQTVFRRGRWQPPVALNTHINAPDTNTKHPALSAGGDTLFFVSDRPGGYGDTDLWMSVASDDAWGPAMNLGEAINTPFREASPFYADREQLLAFASDGREGWGGMDIYLAQMGKDTVTVRHARPPFNSSRDDGYWILGQGQGYLASNREGSFDIYNFYKPESQTLTDFLLGSSPTAVSQTPAFQDMIVEAGISFSLAAENMVAVRSGEKERLSNGSIRFILSSDINDILLSKLEAQAAQEKIVQTSRVLPANSLIANNVIYDNIYFDLNASHLRNEARVVLDEMAAFYQLNPSIQIEINAYTDSTGDVRYNLGLSRQRGQAAFDYLISRGVAPAALVINPQGVSTAMVSTHPLVSQQLNRRVALEIIGQGITCQPPYQTLILKPGVTLPMLTNALPMSREEMMAANGTETPEIHPLKPLRIKSNIKNNNFFYDISTP